MRFVHTYIVPTRQKAINRIELREDWLELVLPAAEISSEENLFESCNFLRIVYKILSHFQRIITPKQKKYSFIELIRVLSPPPLESPKGRIPRVSNSLAFRFDSLFFFVYKNISIIKWWRLSSPWNVSVIYYISV